MDAIDILPHFRGLLIHDHWKTYYCFGGCLHVLCNAHHKRELTRAYEHDHQQWAQDMETLLDQINQAVQDAGSCLPEKESKKWRRKYQAILKKANNECPTARTRAKRTKKAGASGAQ